MVKKRRRHSAACKFRIVLETLEGSKTISQLSSERGIHPNIIRAWKRPMLEDGPRVRHNHDRSHQSLSTITRRRKSTSCSVQSRPHSPKCTLFFPLRGLTIGANHIAPSDA